MACPFWCASSSKTFRSGAVAGGADLHSLLSSTLEKVVDRMRGSPLRRDDPKRQPLAIVELISGGAPSVGRLAPPNETAHRAAGTRPYRSNRDAWRPSDRLATTGVQAAQIHDAAERRTADTSDPPERWLGLQICSDTNLVDVHMGRLRRNVDAPNEAPLIHNIRGVGFILSAEPVSDDSPPDRIINTQPTETKLHDRRVGPRNAYR